MTKVCLVALWAAGAVGRREDSGRRGDAGSGLMLGGNGSDPSPEGVSWLGD